MKQNKPVISVVGLGFVGLSLAVASAKKKFDTYGIEINEEKLRKLRSGKADFFEPRLENYLKEALYRKKLFLTNNLEDVLKTDITFLTVGTPPKNNDQIDLSQLKKVSLELSNILKKKKLKHTVVVKSTAIPTTTSSVIYPLFKKLKNVVVVVNPEFLREGNALNDLFKPHLIVIGESKRNDGKDLESYYKKFYKKLPEILKTDLTSAEMIKYSNNAFLATKISFINSIANICQNLPSVDVKKIAYAIGKDSRIGPQFLNAGPGFGGSCLPKDLSGLINFSKKIGDTGKFFDAVKNVNIEQPNQIIKMMKEMKMFSKNKTVAILGVAFKKDTDDIREAVSIKLVEKLLRKGLKIKVHDPMALENFKMIFEDRIGYTDSIDSCIDGTECCILLTEWKQYEKLRPSDFKTMKRKNIIDARRILNPEKFSKMNFKAIGFGS